MSIGNIVERTPESTAGKRVNYGLILTVGSFRLNEWALSPTQAKVAHERLVKGNDEPFEIVTKGVRLDGTEYEAVLTVSRAPTNDLTAALAG